MKKFFVFLTAAIFATSLPAATVKKSTKPVATKKASTVKKKPPTSNVHPAVKKPKKVERKAVVTKKKTKR